MVNTMTNNYFVHREVLDLVKVLSLKIVSNNKIIRFKYLSSNEEHEMLKDAFHKNFISYEDNLVALSKSDLGSYDRKMTMDIDRIFKNNM